jgi:pyruvate formate-lyase/glycerol dehydratase family glycyl radical enzyme
MTGLTTMDDGTYPTNFPDASARVQRLKSRIEVDGYPLCIEKSRLLTESFKSTEGQPQIIRRARALAHILDNISIFLEADQLIAGNAASKFMGLEIDFYAGLWPLEELDGLRECGFEFSSEEQAEILAMNEYWQSQNPIRIMGEKFDDRMWSFMQTGMVLPPWKSRTDGPGGGYAESGLGLGPGFQLMTVDFEKVINYGLKAIVDEAGQALTENPGKDKSAVERRNYLESIILTHKAIIRFANRFAEFVEGMPTSEPDPIRQAELKRIAGHCRRVPEHPARTFHEALQSLWFIFLMITPSPTASFGRFDQYMYPFYRRDREARSITAERAVELLQCLRLKDMQINRTSGKAARQKNSGMAKWHNMTIGGVTSDGGDATNELTYLVIEAARRCPVPHHTLTLRVHDGTPNELMDKALEVVGMGTGFPAFVGDRSYVDYMIGEGIGLEDARDYAMAGCIDACLPGKSRTVAAGMFIVPMVLVAAMNDGIDPKTSRRIGPATGKFEDFENYPAFVAAFKRQLDHFLGCLADKNNLEIGVYRDLCPDPVRSSLMQDGVNAGKGLLERRFPLENGAVMNPVGMVNVIDSLVVIRKLVFEDQVISRRSLTQALRANWQGEENAALHKQCLAAPKYGNGNAYADEVAADLYAYWADTAGEFETCLGGRHKPTGISVSSQWPGGLLTAATPDGRYDEECLADGAVSPMRGRDVNGPTGNIRSALKIDQAPFQATLFNMKFHPSALTNEADRRKISLLIRTYFAEGGKHIQFNIVDRDTLLDAQQNPQNYSDLLVRVAGYSARFVSLSKAMQDEIICRTEHKLSA